MKITIRDVAKQANVSIATVSRVINNKTDGITEEMRAHVQKVVEELNYHPNSLARSLVTKRTYTITLIVQDVLNSFFSQLAVGAQKAASERDYLLLLSNSDGSILEEEKCAMLMKEKSMDGIIIAANNAADRAHIERVLSCDIPIVFVDEVVEDVNLVCVNNTDGVYNATKYLIEMGHQKIAFLPGPENSISAEQRYKGYQMALQEAGLSVLDIPSLEGGYLEYHGKVNAARALQAVPDITAFMCVNDAVLIGAYTALYEMGKTVPDDISMVGFDDFMTTLPGQFGFTTVRQPTYKMGVSAAKLLIDLIENKKSHNTVIVYDTELIKRDSVKNLNEGRDKRLS